MSTSEPGHPEEAHPEASRSDESQSGESQSGESPTGEERPAEERPEVVPPWLASETPMREQDLLGNPRTSRVNQPWRVPVACAELLVALLMITASVWAWQRGSITIETELGAEMTRLFGSWLTLSVLFVTIAGLTVLDSGRQLLLALGTARRRGLDKVAREQSPEAG